MATMLRQAQRCAMRSCSHRTLHAHLPLAFARCGPSSPLTPSATCRPGASARPRSSNTSQTPALPVPGPASPHPVHRRTSLTLSSRSHAAPPSTPRGASVRSRAVRTLVDHSAAAQAGPDVRVEVQADEAGVAQALVQAVEQAAAKALADKGSFTLAVPGGSVLKMLSGLSTSTAGIDWSKVHLAYVNHKCVPLDDKSSTHKKARDYFIDKVGIPPSNVLALQGSSAASAEAAAYEAGLKQLLGRVSMATTSGGVPVFDLMLIGMGSDGHVGSLYPGKPETTATHAWVLPVVKAEGASSVTLSHPVMSAARTIIICMTGSKKAPAVRQALEVLLAAGAMPAQMIRGQAGSSVMWLMDSGAAAELQGVQGLRALL